MSEQWIPLKEGDRLPGDVMLAVLVDQKHYPYRTTVFEKEWPEWPKIIGWTHYFPLPVFEAAGKLP